MATKTKTETEEFIRLSHLLEEASKAFEDMRDPFSTEWLVEHEVTADECHDLSLAISLAISAAIDIFRVMSGMVSE